MMQKWQHIAWLKALYFDKTEMEKLLILSCLFSVGMSGLRIAYTDKLLFLSLNWNLFLALVPYALSRWLLMRPHWIDHHLRFGLVFAVWLLFIPNSFYIITDLFHLHAQASVPLWFDLALILSFAWNGLLLGVLSMRQMEKMVELKLSLRTSAAFVLVLMFLNAVGIYLGRYLRYNSWDVLSNPFQLFGDILSLALHPLRNWADWSMILCYTVLMLLMYEGLKKLSKAIW